MFERVHDRGQPLPLDGGVVVDERHDIGAGRPNADVAGHRKTLLIGLQHAHRCGQQGGELRRQRRVGVDDDEQLGGSTRAGQERVHALAQKRDAPVACGTDDDGYRDDRHRGLRGTNSKIQALGRR
jgi:hypothetical protein